MRTSLKTLVRAISPFVAPKGRTDQDTPVKAFKDFHWDLTKVDMETMLSNFYKAYNPERVSKVNEILHEYEGEELLMLQQLCERYNLSEADIQRFLDDAPLGKKDRFGNWMRKKSEGSVSFSENGSVDGKTKPVDYGTYKWDLDNVDLAKAVKLLYRKHNPEKKPNVASLQGKTAMERTLLLQQLCKRHGLSQGEMAEFLDKARIKDTASTGSGRAAPPAKEVADDASVSSKGKSSGAAALAAAAAGLFSSPPPPPPPAPASTGRAPSAGASTAISGTARGSALDAPNVITGDSLQRQGSVSLWPSSFPSPFGSPPPPPPPPVQPVSAPASGIAGFLAEALASKNSPVSEVASVNSSVTAPSLTSGMGSRSKLEAAVAARNAGVRAPSPAPSVLSTSSIGSASVGRGRNQREATAAAAKPPATLLDENDLPISAGRKTDAAQKKRGAVGAASVTTESSAGAARTMEVVQLQKELSEARAKLAGMEKENRALLKALQESKQRQSDAESTISGLSSQLHPEQVPELLLEVSKLQAGLKQQEDRELALKRQYSQLKQQNKALQQQRVEAEQRCVEARADFRDVLRLVDIMSASPAGIKAVLEAYLKKLGEATNNVTVKFGIGQDGRQVPISERIAIALQAKRDQEKAAAKADGENAGGADGDGEGTAVDEAGGEEATSASQVSKSGGSVQQRGGLQKSQQDNFELYRSKIAQARQQQQQQKPGRARGKSEEVSVGRDPELQVEGAPAGEAEEGEGNDFADYASPAASRTSKRPTTTSAADSVPGSGADGSGDLQPVQATMAGAIATDWIECFDPRSRRKYYYSAALKKSTWVKPANFGKPAKSATSGAAAGEGTVTMSSATSGVPSRYASPIGPARSSPQPWGAEAGAEEPGRKDPTNDRARSLLLSSGPRTQASDAGATIRSPSPYSSDSLVASSTSSSAASFDYNTVFTSPAKGLSAPAQQDLRAGPARQPSTSSRTSSPALSLHSRTTRSSSPAGDSKADWVAATDPKSQRTYWYNRKTKVSTWRQPAELIV